MGFLSKLTTIAAIIFMITSLLLAFTSTRRASSIVRGKPAQSAPVAPAEPQKVPVQPQDASQAILQLGDRVTHAPHAELAELGEVLADLRRVQVELARELGGGNRRDAGRVEL